MYMPTTTHILSDETGQLILEQLQAISQALDDGALTNTQIDTVLADQSPTGAGFLDGGGLKRFFDGLQVQFDALGESVSQTIKVNSYTECTVVTANGTVQITGAPSTFLCIPVVISHSVNLQVNENVFADDSKNPKWYINSTLSQSVTIRFYQA